MAKSRQTSEWWDALRERFISGSVSIKELAEEHKSKVSISAMRKRSLREHWMQRRAEFRQRRENARRGAEGTALKLTAATQAETRANYALRAREMADWILSEARRLVDGRNASTLDLARLAQSLRACQSVEFAALGIASDTIHLSDSDDGRVLTWAEMMARERERKGLASYNFSLKK